MLPLPPPSSPQWASAHAVSRCLPPSFPPPSSPPRAVGQFRDLVEMAERNKPLRETLKQVLRLTKGWDIARDHVRRAVETDVQLRVFHPDGRIDVGLVFKCGAFNVVEMHRPVGLLRRKTNPQQSNQVRWGGPRAHERGALAGAARGGPGMWWQVMSGWPCSARAEPGWGGGLLLSMGMAAPLSSPLPRCRSWWTSSGCRWTPAPTQTQ